MERYTNKIEYGNEVEYQVSVHTEGGWDDSAQEKQYLANQKLGKIEDIEEELGCPIEVMFRAIKNGIFYRPNYEKRIDNKSFIIYENELRHTKPNLYSYSNEKQSFFMFYIYGDNTLYNRDYFLSEYKKTWWLKKDKSE